MSIFQLVLIIAVPILAIFFPLLSPIWLPAALLAYPVMILIQMFNHTGFTGILPDIFEAIMEFFRSLFVI